MLNKEKIENKIKPIGEMLQDKINRLSEENFRQSQYIEQLESDKQKLIEKLENKFDNIEKQKLPNFKTVADMIKYKGYAEGKIESYNEILKIAKGENE